MKKVSTASFIIGIVLIVLAVALNVLGFLDINGIRYVHYGNRFYSMTYTTTSSSAQMVCIAMIIAGGFLFLGGILLLMLSALTCPCRCKGHGNKPEETAKKAADNTPCFFKDEEAKAENPAEEPAAEPVEEQATEQV